MADSNFQHPLHSAVSLLCSDSSMADSNLTMQRKSSAKRRVQIPLWPIVTGRAGQGTTGDPSSDSSMADSNQGSWCNDLQGERFRFLYGR